MDFYLVAVLDKDGEIFTMEIDEDETIEELSGDHFSKFYTDEKKRKGVPERDLELAKEEVSKNLQMMDLNGFEDATVEAGRASLIRIFSNLIINSIKHNDKQIHIEVGPLEDRKGFYYQDNGDGILKQEREKVFKKNYSSSQNGGF
jgi:signal transduction histidine kinase